MEDMISDERWNRLEYIIDEAVPEDIPGWRFRYSKQVAAAVEAAGFRRAEVPEPSTDRKKLEAIRKYALGAPRNAFSRAQIMNILDREENPEPQGEPSDAQVDAAARVLNPEAWKAYDTPYVENPALLVAYSRAQARAALRAAGGAR